MPDDPSAAVTWLTHRCHAAGEIEPDHVVVGIDGRRTRQRQRGRVVDAHQRQRPLLARRCCRYRSGGPNCRRCRLPRSISKPACGTGVDRGAVDRPVGQGARHRRRQSRRAGSAPGPAPRRASRDRPRSRPERIALLDSRSTSLPFGPLSTIVPTVAQRRIVAPVRRRVHGALRIELQRRCVDADELNAGIGEHRYLIEVAGDDLDVHHLRELVDIEVAPVEQVRRGRVTGAGGRRSRG